MCAAFSLQGIKSFFCQSANKFSQRSDKSDYCLIDGRKLTNYMSTLWEIGVAIRQNPEENTRQQIAYQACVFDSKVGLLTKSQTDYNLKLV